MRALALACFFLSGASSLVFQVIWTRLLGLVFGTTTLAMSTVVGSFMGGLALGSYLAGRIADRLRDALKVYALAEAGIGVCALLMPPLISTFPALNAWTYANFGAGHPLVALARFLLAALAILVPTTLMGATLPLLARYFVSHRREHPWIGSRVAMLYAANTAGAVVGTLGGGFVLLPRLGTTLANACAAAMNLLLAATVALAYAWRARRRSPPTEDEVQLRELRDELARSGSAPSTASLPLAPRAQQLVLAAFAISGATAMTYEIIWARTLSMIIGSSIYSFTIVLAAFLIGLSGGAALAGQLMSRARVPLLWLAACHVAISGAAALTHVLIDKLPAIYVNVMAAESLRVGSILRTQLVLALVLMIPATVAMGGVLPLTIRALARSADDVGRDVGRAYALNTLGAIAGSFAAGFVIIPVLQLQPGLRAAGLTNLALAVLLGAVATRRAWGGESMTLRRAAIFGTSACVALVWLLLPAWDLYGLTIGPFRPSVAKDVMSGAEPRAELVFYRDGLSTTVTVEKWSAEHFSLKNNGKVDASTGDDMPTQITVGLLPLLLHPRTPARAPRVALIGLASGVTAGAILQYPHARLDVVELEPAIEAASHFFDHVNHRPLEDRRLRLISDDGRNYLATTPERYDVIINEPSNPWITGVSNLFTFEYFELARERLRPDGIFCSWAQMYELGPRRIKAIYRAFARAFPYTVAFAASALSSDTLLVGSTSPLVLDIARMRRVAAIPSVRRELARAGVAGPDDLVALTLLAPGEVHAFTAGAQTNTDDNALVEFAAPRDLYDHGRYDDYLAKIYGRNWAYGRLTGFIRGYESSDEFAELVYSLLRQGRSREAEVFAARVRCDAGARSQLVLALMELVDPSAGETPQDPPIDDDAPLAPPAIAPGTPGRAKILADYARVLDLRRRRDPCGAVELIETWPEKLAETAGDEFNLLWGVLNYHCTSFDKARNILEPLGEKRGFVARRPALLFYLGQTLYLEGEFQRGLKLLGEWLRVGRGGAVGCARAPAPPE